MVYAEIEGIQHGNIVVTSNRSACHRFYSIAQMNAQVAQKNTLTKSLLNQLIKNYGDKMTAYLIVGAMFNGSDKLANIPHGI